MTATETQIPSTMPSMVSASSSTTPVKPGYMTTEFYVTIITALTPIVMALFHTTLKAEQVQDIAGAAAGVGTVAYTMSRAWVKKTAHAQTFSAKLAPSPPSQSDLQMILERLDELKRLEARRSQRLASSERVIEVD